MHEVLVTRPTRSQVRVDVSILFDGQSQQFLTWNWSREIGRNLVENPRKESLFHWRQIVELEAYSDADWRGDKSTRRSVSEGNNHEWWTLIESMGQEAAGGVTVRRKWRCGRH